jgi:drug/metabolite transporter (DMT)-like permease
MLWAIFSIICAFAQALMEGSAKRAIQAGNDRRVVLGIRFGLAAVILSPLMLFTSPPTNPTFWLLHLAWLPLEVTAALLIVRAMQLSPLSLTLPYIALTPAFLLLIEGVAMGRWANPIGVAGVGLIVIGSYVLNRGDPDDPASRGWLAPFRAIVREPGTRLMLVVALVYSLTALLASELTRMSDPFYFSFHFPLAVFVALSPFTVKAFSRTPKINWHWSLGLGAVALALMSITNMLAFDLGSHVAYVIALKRLSAIFGVLLGRFMFTELQMGQRLTGATLMAGGSALIVLAHDLYRWLAGS